ncbi:short chain dehydrogenase/reductase [Penicillium lividum]|nr:short chain dehydrogenase/reductase [Penicillium lividum]
MSQKRNIIVTDINPQTGAQTLAQLRTEFPSAEISFEECDVSSWESQATAFEKTYNQHGSIDLVFANAGITEKGSFLPKDVNAGPVKPNLATLNVNLIGVVYSVQLAIHYMSRNGGGLICCTASNAGLYPFPMAPMYAATKHGVIGLVRSLARSLVPNGIRINALAPAVIETNIAPSSDLFKSMIITPMSTVFKAVEMFVDDESLTGKVAELHGEHATLSEPPAYVDEDTGKNIETFWNLGYA